MSSSPKTPAKPAPKVAHKIGLISCLAFAVGTMVGGGVFALSGTVVAKAGTGSIIGYIAAGVIMMLSALCFAAVSSRAKPGDSGYGPIGDELGQVWRFITMWAFYICGVAGVAFVLVSFAQYLNYFMNIKPADLIWVGLAAAVAIVLLNFGPADLVAKAETAMVIFKVSVLLVLIAFGLAAFMPEQLANAWPKDGASSVMWAAALLFTAYTGFNVVTNMAGEVKNPQKTVPKAILLSLGIVAIIYIGVAIALVMSKISSAELANAGLAHAAEKLGEPLGIGAFLGVLVAIAACVSTLSGANANLLGSSELIIRMAARGDIPSFLGKISRGGHALMSVALTGVIVIVLMASGAFETIVVFSNVAAVIAMVLVDLTALRMAWKKWKTPGMKLPLGIVIPVLAIVGALSNIPQYAWWQNLVGAALVALGFIIYAFRGHSKKEHVDNINAQIAAKNTPLMRAARRVEHAPAASSTPPTPPASSSPTPTTQKAAS